MAMQDAIELASGLTERYGEQDDGRRPASYTQVRLLGEETRRGGRWGYTVGSSPPSMTWLVPVR